jgi:hypothetical protein
MENCKDQSSCHEIEKDLKPAKKVQSQLEKLSVRAQLWNKMRLNFAFLQYRRKIVNRLNFA